MMRIRQSGQCTTESFKLKLKTKCGTSNVATMFFFTSLLFLCPALYLCRVAKKDFVSEGPACIGRPKIPLGSGSIEASPGWRPSLFMACSILHDFLWEGKVASNCVQLG